jgi:hypothetical protein
MTNGSSWGMAERIVGMKMRLQLMNEESLAGLAHPESPLIPDCGCGVELSV